MAHKIAKLMLEQSRTFLDRSEAVKTAVSLGMPLHEIEEYLDWLDVAGQAKGRDEAPRGRSSKDRRPKAG